MDLVRRERNGLCGCKRGWSKSRHYIDPDPHIQRLTWEQLTLRSSVQKFTTVYNLKVRYEAPSGQIWQDEEIKGKFVEWFNDAGLLQHEALKQWLAQKVEVVGQAQAFGKSHVQKIENRTPVKGSTEVETPSTKTKKPRKQA